MDVCVKEDPTLQDQNLDHYIDGLVTSLGESIKQGGTNEAVSYVDDIQEFRPDAPALIERIAVLFDKSGFYEEEKAIVTKSMQRMKKSDGYSIATSSRSCQPESTVLQGGTEVTRPVRRGNARGKERKSASREYEKGDERAPVRSRACRCHCGRALVYPRCS